MTLSLLSERMLPEVSGTLPCMPYSRGSAPEKELTYAYVNQVNISKIKPVYFTIKHYAWAVYLCNKLNEFTRLLPNWNSYTASMIDRRALNTTLHVANYIANVLEINPSASIVPTIEGGVTFEWCTSKGYLTIEIMSDGYNINYFYANPERTEFIEKDITIETYQENQELLNLIKLIES
jgi:hypothetical protein